MPSAATQLYYSGNEKRMMQVQKATHAVKKKARMKMRAVIDYLLI